jgi:hypothetical protein
MGPYKARTAFQFSILQQSKQLPRISTEFSLQARSK